MFTGSLGGKAYLDKLEDAFSILDKFLEGQDWVAGNSITIADYSIVATVASIHVRTLQFVVFLRKSYMYVVLLVLETSCLYVAVSHSPNCITHHHNWLHNPLWDLAFSGFCNKLFSWAGLSTSCQPPTNLGVRSSFVRVFCLSWQVAMPKRRELPPSPLYDLAVYTLPRTIAWTWMHKTREEYTGQLFVLLVRVSQ
jgi:hypothetical protein